MTRPELRRLNWPDRLSGWTLPPPMARVVGEVEPVRMFESAEAAMAFLAGDLRDPRGMGSCQLNPRVIPGR